MLSWAKGRPAPGPGGTCAAERRDGRRALGVGPPGWAGELFSGPTDLEKARPAHMGSEQAVGDTALAAGQHLLLGVGPLQALGLCGRWVLCGGELWSGGLDFSREPYRGPIQPPGSRASGSERVCLWALGVGWTLHGRRASGVGRWVGVGRWALGRGRATPGVAVQLLLPPLPPLLSSSPPLFPFPLPPRPTGACGPGAPRPN